MLLAALLLLSALCLTGCDTQKKTASEEEQTLPTLETGAIELPVIPVGTDAAQPGETETQPEETKSQTDETKPQPAEDDTKSEETKQRYDDAGRESVNSQRETSSQSEQKPEDGGPQFTMTVEDGYHRVRYRLPDGALDGSFKDEGFTVTLKEIAVYDEETPAYDVEQSFVAEKTINGRQFRYYRTDGRELTEHIYKTVISEHLRYLVRLTVQPGYDEARLDRFLATFEFDVD